MNDTARGVSRKFCSSSGAFSRTRGINLLRKASLKQRSGAPVESIRCSSVGDGKTPGRSTFSSAPAVEGISPVQIQRSKSGFNAVSDDVEVVAQDIMQDIVAELEISLHQQMIQGFSEISFDGSFAMVLNHPVSGAGTEVLAASASMYQPKYVLFAKTAEEENILIERFINVTIVGSAGVFALTKLFTIDYWHGWISKVVRDGDHFLHYSW